MSDANRSQDEPAQYAIRFRETASRDLNAAIVYLSKMASDADAAQWKKNILSEIATLATLPRRCAVAPERFRLEVRRMLYRRANSATAYWVYFTIEGEAAESPDSPTVVIRHVRHSATKPLTRAQIRAIEATE